MKLSEQSNWFLTSLELALCLQILGQEKRTVLPVAASEQPIRQRMLDCFLHLAEIGLMAPADGGYAPTELLRSRLLPVSDPEAILTLPDGDSPMAVYVRGDVCAVLTVQGTDGQLCQIGAVGRSELSETVEEHLRAMLSEMPCVELRAPDGSLKEWVRFSADGANGTEPLTPAALGRLLDRLAPAETV